MSFTRLPARFPGEEMFEPMPRLLLMACLLSSSFLWPSSSWALGLGEIHLKSALNEPMNAEIDLIAATPDELTALRASLDGRDTLLVHSTDAIPEPFVTFLIEVNWARGRLMREYTVLLDPPVYTPGESARSSAPVAAPTTSARPPATVAAPAAVAPPAAAPPAAAPPSSTTPPPPRRGAAPPSMQA